MEKLINMNVLLGEKLITGWTRRNFFDEYKEAEVFRDAVTF